ncbi:MAG: ferritin [Candidatus Omnitrophica bacterium]|nr:ferritin [Candidatus Omnitrophota bacterium]
MVSKKVLKLLNEQVALEGESSQIYLAMATWADVNGFRGTAAFMYRQAEEERGHMQKFIKFINDLTEHAEIGGIKEPKADYKDIEEVFRAALEHEELITAAIAKIFTTARENNDYAVTSFLKWFIDEQVEEEAAVKRVLDIIRMAGKVSIYLADKEIGALHGGK